MKLPRNVKIFRGQLDAAPFISVFFLLALFLLLSSKLVFTPGVKIELPSFPDSLPGTSNPTIVAAIDKNGQVYFEDHLISQERFSQRLKELVSQSKEALTLEIQADAAVRLEAVAPVLVLARNAGVKEALIAGRSPLRPGTKPEKASK
jgi:biopolymer transport protein ExbD